MIGRGLFLLTMLSSCVLSLPVTSGQLENEDVKVMKCIVEVLVEALSQPHAIHASQECLVTLKTDDRMVSLLRHRNFLKELQEIAVQGSEERAQLRRDIDTPSPATQTLQTAGDVADRSMLEALGGPGERSILSQKKRTGNGDRKEEKNDSVEDGELREDNEVEEVQVKRENDESPGSHISQSVDQWSEGEAVKREEEAKGEYGEKRENSEENSEEENVSKDMTGDGSDEKRHAPAKKSKAKKSDEKGEEDKDKRSALFSHKHEDREEEQEEEEEEDEEVKRGSRESLKRWAERAKSLSPKKKAVGKAAQQEVPHHSKEVVEEEEEEEDRDTRRSPEEKELRMIAQRVPEEEGSGSRKSEEPEIESLAAIETELENVAQKLHGLQRG